MDYEFLEKRELSNHESFSLMLLERIQKLEEKYHNIKSLMNTSVSSFVTHHQTNKFSFVICVNKKLCADEIKNFLTKTFQYILSETIIDKLTMITYYDEDSYKMTIDVEIDQDLDVNMLFANYIIRDFVKNIQDENYTSYVRDFSDECYDTLCRNKFANYYSYIIQYDKASAHSCFESIKMYGDFMFVPRTTCVNNSPISDIINEFYQKGQSSQTCCHYTFNLKPECD
jgi:hypothetical protein